MQILTGHGGIASYLYKYKFKATQGCECDPNIEKTVWHIILDCPRLSSVRLDLETLINIKLERGHLATIMADNLRRPIFLEYLLDIFSIAMHRNGSKIAKSRLLREGKGLTSLITGTAMPNPMLTTTPETHVNASCATETPVSLGYHYGP